MSETEGEYLSDADFIYFDEARRQKVVADAVYDFVQTVLVTKLKLEAGDQIQPDGKIIRFRTVVREKLEEAAREAEQGDTHAAIQTA